jgi:3'-phosphoadenosine 5'-phosphosulfate sulfotransferase (PAPS reductase)/FAD synthetase
MMQAEHYRLHARLPAHRRRVEAAAALIGRALSELSPRPFVACSFGKDSAVLLHLVQQQCPDIEARFLRWPETELMGDFDRVIGEWRARGANVCELDLWRASAGERVPDRWARLQALSPAAGYFIGLRAEESKGRRASLRCHGDYYTLASGLVRVAPLAWWALADVAAYVAVHDLPTLKNYRELGIAARTASRVPRASGDARQMALTDLQRMDPVAHARLRQLYPDL